MMTICSILFEKFLGTVWDPSIHKNIVKKISYPITKPDSMQKHYYSYIFTFSKATIVWYRPYAWRKKAWKIPQKYPLPRFGFINKNENENEAWSVIGYSSTKIAKCIRSIVWYHKIPVYIEQCRIKQTFIVI